MTKPPNVRLDGRIALVTGSSRGLGRATALALARAGADVVVTYRKQAEEAEAVAGEIRGLGRKAWVHALEMGDVASIDALFDSIAAEAGGLDVAVLNAAATAFKPLMEAEPRHLERTYAISTVGFLRAVQRAVPMMEARGGGTILGISGADTRTYIPAHGILAGAKAAMEAMIRYLACEIGERGVTLLGVNPGTVMSDSMRTMLGDAVYEHAVRYESRTHPLRTAARPDDVAEPVVLLCSPAARFLHGSIIDADAGSVFAMCGRWMEEGTRALVERGKVEAAEAGPSAKLR
ncbi:MAG: SDR family oxidoreductase [Myxococcales bacterium]|nr:SDR family oxidoreductase [Myxococcales bacterium]